jgi:imidazolonepropionase-like amidohydrolase
MLGRLGILLSFLSAATGFAETRVLRGFTLIDGTGRAPVADAAIVITDGRITWAGPISKLQVPAGAEIVDLEGKYVIPGIINLHGHLANTRGLTQSADNYTRENLEDNLKTYASYGVTSVLSLGSDQDLVYQVRSEQRAGRPRLTRIFTAGRGFTGEAGYPTSAPGMKGVPFEIGSATEAKSAVAGLADRKVDAIKIWVDDHLGRERKIPLELSKAVIDAAHQHGIKTAAHIFYLGDAKALVESGLDALAHSVRDAPVDDALISLMKKRGAWQAAATLTRELSTFVYADRPKWLDDPFFTRSVAPGVTATLKSDQYRKRMAADPDFARLPGFLETAKRNLKRLADAGVKFGFGTDTGPPARFPGYFEHMEMQLMVDAGLTPMQVLQAATRSSAEFLGESKNLGTLEAGRWADLVVLDRNPLEDIGNTRSIQQVYIAGNRL